MSSVGRISLDLNINSKKFGKQVDGIQKQTTKAFSFMSVAVGNIMARMAEQAVASVGNFVKDSIDKGSELSELQNVVDSVFTSMSDKVETFADNALEAYGLTETQAKKMVGTFGAMSKSFGYSEQQAYDMSTALTGLAGDVASFYNLNHDEAYTKLKSVFTGETESLKELGVVMTQTAIDEFALANGFGKTTSKMSEQEKVALRLAFVQDKLATATGDFTRTQDQWANQTRILQGQIESFQAALGQGFINILTPVIRMLNVLMGKLVQVANAFKSFTESIMGKKSGGNAGAVMAEVADAADSAASSTGGIEDAANGAASAAKKAQKSLMGFDEINKLSSNDTGDGGSGGGSPIDLDFGSPLQAAEQATTQLTNKVSELIELLKAGFKDGLGSDFEASLGRIKEHASSIKKEIQGIFSDGKVVASAKSAAGSIAYAFGQIAGSFVSIGTSISEMLVGGIDKYLQQNAGFIKDRLVGIFTVSGEFATTLGNLYDAIGSVFEVLRGDSAKSITGDLIAIFANSKLGIMELAARIGTDVLNMIAQPIIDNQDKIKLALENTLKPISVITATVSAGVTATFEKIFEVYNQYVQPAFDRFAAGISSIVSTVLDAYNTHIAPVLDSLATKFSELWATSIQPTINKIIEVIGKVIEILSLLWQNVLVPLINWIVANLVPVVAPILETLGNLVMTLFQKISGVVSGIFDVLGGLIDFIIGVFTGDWSRAWEGIKSIFTGIFTAISNAVSLVMATISGIITTALQTIKGAVQVVLNGIWTFIKNIINVILGGIESLVNGVIGGMNKMVSALNKLSFGVPDWVPIIGGGKFGFNLPSMSTVSLPRLAEGGYARANQPQPVIVGDNKRHGEIISPEDKMLSITLKALEQFFGRLKDIGYSSRGDGEVGDIIIPIYLDGSMLDEVIVTAQQRRNIRSGGR